MSKANFEHRLRLTHRLLEEVKNQSFAVREVRIFSEILAGLVHETQVSNTGIRKTEIADTCRYLLMLPALEFLSNLPEPVRSTPTGVLSDAFGNLNQMHLIADDVAHCADFKEVCAAKYLLDPLGNEQSLRIVACQTMDLMLSVARFVQLWPQSTVSQDSSRRRNDSKGSILCDFCHRPTARYAHWHGMKTPDAGLVVGSRQMTNDPPDKRLSQKYCDAHSKSGEDRQRNAGNYSSSLTKKHSSPGARTDIGDYLRSRGLGVPHSIRLRTLVTWMRARKTVAAREWEKHRERIISERPRAQRLIDKILATLPGPPRITIDDNLLEVEIRPDGDCVILDVSGRETHFAWRKQPEIWNTRLLRLLADLRKRFPLSEASAFESVWSEALGLEIFIINGKSLRFTFESPSWIEAATGSKKVDLT